MGRIIDRTGQKFNSWAFIEQKGTNKHGESLWLCVCDCEFKKIQVAGNITSNGSRSCMECSKIHSYNDEIPVPVWKTIIKNAYNRSKHFIVRK